MASAPAARMARTYRSAWASRHCWLTDSRWAAPADGPRQGTAPMRPMWIPNALYEALPMVYIAAGVLQLLCAFFIDIGPRALLLGLGALCMTAGLVVWMRR